MKRTTLLRIVPILTALALLITLIGWSSSVSADGGKNGSRKPATKPPEVVERVVDRTPVFSPQGQLVGILTTVVGSITVENALDSGRDFTQTAAVTTATYPTRTTTCYSKVWLDHWTGWYRLWEMTLRQTWGYNGSRIVWYYQPDVEAWSRYGWSHTEPKKGIYWTINQTRMRTWASSQFTFGLKGYTVQSKSAYIAFNIAADGQCFY